MTYPYFHDGSVATLEEAVRVMGRLQASTDLGDRAGDIAAFLRTLTGTVPEEAKGGP
jgi:cytochrome c peroxidase